jgi:hypothetical protein
LSLSVLGAALYFTDRPDEELEMLRSHFKAAGLP